MVPLTSAWTDRHLPALAALVVAGIAGALSTVEPAACTLVGVGAVLATAALGLLLDAFGGIVLGLSAAACVIAVQRVAGVWTSDRFAQSFAFTLSLVALGWLCGALASRLRPRPGEVAQLGAPRPAFGSLGLLSEDAAMARLEEEILRSRRHRRPLSVLVLRTSTDSGVSAAVRNGSSRAVARVLETLLRDTDVPFALADDELGAVLPETGQAAAWDLLGPILETASSASFAVREDGERRSVADTSELHAGLVALSDDTQTASDLLRRARELALADEQRLAAEAGTTGRESR